MVRLRKRDPKAAHKKIRKTLRRTLHGQIQLSRPQKQKVRILSHLQSLRFGNRIHRCIGVMLFFALKKPSLLILKTNYKLELSAIKSQLCLKAFKT